MIHGNKRPILVEIKDSQKNSFSLVTTRFPGVLGKNQIILERLWIIPVEHYKTAIPEFLEHYA